MGPGSVHVRNVTVVAHVDCRRNSPWNTKAAVKSPGNTGYGPCTCSSAEKALEDDAGGNTYFTFNDLLPFLHQATGDTTVIATAGKLVEGRQQQRQSKRDFVFCAVKVNLKVWLSSI